MQERLKEEHKGVRQLKESGRGARDFEREHEEG
jgi:hypothetical protein